MQPDRPLLLLYGLLLALVITCAPATAQAQGRIETGGLYHRYTGGFGPWYGAYVSGQYRFKTGTTVRAHYFWQERYGDTGISYQADVTHDVSPRLYARGIVHTSSGGFFIPRIQTEAQIAAKWGDRNQFVTQAALGYIDAKDYHRDVTYATEAVYYFENGWVAQATVRWNHSMPEAQLSRYHYAAVSRLAPKRYELTLRGAFGNEAYALVGPVTLFQNYESWSVGASYRHWLSSRWGMQLTLDHYRNPFFLHQGAQAGLFIDL